MQNHTTKYPLFIILLLEKQRCFIIDEGKTLS